MQHASWASSLSGTPQLTPLARAGRRRGDAPAAERLPFTVRLVRNEADLMKAVAIRHAAYARHVPQLAASLALPEAIDTEDGVAILLAESKLDGAPLGSMRIQTNRQRPLVLERSVQLPDWLACRSLAEATRLGVTGDQNGRLVKTVLFKAFYQYCLHVGIEWMVVAARAPIDRQYAQLLFADVFPERAYLPLQHAGNLPHRVLSFEVGTAEQRWIEAEHPLYGFMCVTRHADIDILAPEVDPVQ